MHTNLASELLRREHVGLQMIILPTSVEWAALLSVGRLDGLPMVSEDAAKQWLESYGHVKEAALGIHLLRGSWWTTPLLRLRGRYYHVHFEDVICEHCGQRCGLSAKPNPDQYMGMSAADAWAEFEPFPVLPCPHCGGLLHRRQTFWLAGRADESSGHRAAVP